MQGHRTARVRRALRTRSRIAGSSPRLSVFRSNRHLSAQLIDDAAGVTLVAASDIELAAGASKTKTGRMWRAAWVGERLAERARLKGIAKCRFDRGRYRYHGLVAAVAAGARKGGLAF